jgi:hypothetical protein
MGSKSENTERYAEQQYKIPEGMSFLHLRYEQRCKGLKNYPYLVRPHKEINKERTN